MRAFVCVWTHTCKYRDSKIYPQPDSFPKPKTRKILCEGDSYVKCLSPTEVMPQIWHQLQVKPHLIIWEILRNPKGERRCITSTLGGNEATGKVKLSTHVRTLWPHTTSQLPGEQSQCVDLNLKCHDERESSMWHLSPIARDTPCFLPQLSMLFLDGDKEEANWEQSQRAQEWIWCLGSLNI